MKKKKRILMLGGADIQVSAIKKAKEMGYYVITCDYLPENPGHVFSDEYFNVSTTNKDAVLKLAKKLDLDGILAYASDPAALTSAYVSEKLGLPTNSYKAVELMSRKDLFRKFMIEKGFLTPKTITTSKYDEVVRFINHIKKPIVIKPVDSSGSKGVYKILPDSDFHEKFEHTIAFSRLGMIIAEEFINKKGYQIGGDGFMVDGKLVFRCFGDIHFSKANPMLPCSVSIPTLHTKDITRKVHDKVQQLLTAIGMNIGALNFDIIIDENNEINILEIGARNGGNMIPELTKLSTGIDMIEYSIKTAVGEPIEKLKMGDEKKYFSHYVIHSPKSGIVKKISKSEKLKSHLLFEHYNFKVGDKVDKFMSSANRLGIMLLEYKNKEEMIDLIYNMDKNLVLTIHDEFKVSIRPLKKNDAKTSVKWRNNPVIWRHTLNSPDREITINDEKRWINKVLSSESSKRFAIEVNSKYVGNVQLTSIQNRESYFGIFIGDTSYWGKGVGTEATKLILKYAFEKLKLKKVKLRVKVDNESAKKVYENLGFVIANKDDELLYMELLNNQ